MALEGPLGSETATLTVDGGSVHGAESVGRAVVGAMRAGVGRLPAQRPDEPFGRAVVSGRGFPSPRVTNVVST